MLFPSSKLPHVSFLLLNNFFGVGVRILGKPLGSVGKLFAYVRRIGVRQLREFNISFRGRSDSSWWREIERIHHGVEGLGGGWFGDSVMKQVRDGMETFFWTDTWLGRIPLCVRFRRQFDLAINKSSTVAEMSSLGWETDGEVDSLDAVADLIWHKHVPLKVSIVAWRLLRDRLPTKDNLAN
ncbi:hypothetical protein TSUD_124970 [Trifolium subterraneum]|uniref:Reverse transcriptase zinc-binding domain-containing protein n=1 Tax=Trifolium subterraneum TaxID=3900 RepID=A0A2Z6LM34_TRISU|nr:hypothetical protein TSUD_124970 [Trifolium subterraneum]